jgi:uncharacterized protein DUF3892
MNREVTCTNKRDRQNPHERTQAIGGAGWKHSESAAIRRIQAGVESYFVTKVGRKARVIVATHLGREYLQTEADAVTPDNLLALPECP